MHIKISVPLLNHPLIKVVVDLGSEPFFCATGHSPRRKRQRAADAEALREFVAQWELEDMPACPVGMGLLFAFAQAAPGAYGLAQRHNFADVPQLANNARWQAFAAHRTAAYPDCNESGPLSHPYNGARR